MNKIESEQTNVTTDTSNNITNPTNITTNTSTNITTNTSTNIISIPDIDTNMNVSKDTIISQIKKYGDEWAHIDDKIKDYKDYIKNLNNKKKELTDTIIHKMKVHGISCIDINDGFLQCIEKPTPTGLKKDRVKESVNKCINNMNKATEITECIFNNKEVTTKHELKKIRKRKIRKTRKSENNT